MVGLGALAPRRITSLSVLVHATRRRAVHFDRKPEFPNHLGSIPRNNTKRATMMDFVDYYQTLGVKRSDSLEDFKRAYYQLAKRYHPDKPIYHDRLSKKWYVNSVVMRWKECT